MSKTACALDFLEPMLAARQSRTRTESSEHKQKVMSITRSFRSSGLKYALPLLLAAVALAGPAAAADPEAGPFTEESNLDKAQAVFYRQAPGCGRRRPLASDPLPPRPAESRTTSRSIHQP